MRTAGLKKRSVLPSEHQIQAAFVEWCALNESKYPGLDTAFAVPNGARTSPSVARRLKAEGMRAGVPDWMLPIAVWDRYEQQDRWKGLAIEFKSKTGKLSDEQAEYHGKLFGAGWLVEVCRSTEEAIAVVGDYYR